jgi:predicted O-methyltransferase YrrM
MPRRLRRFRKNAMTIVRRVFRRGWRFCRDLPHHLGLTGRTLAAFPHMEPVDKRTYRELRRITRFSMLHVHTLMGLRHLVQVSQGSILEIGPYTGGSTVVMARALKEKAQRRPFLTVEVGGSYLTHPTHASDDILGDLRRNLARYQVDDVVRILVGWSNEPHIVRELLAAGEREPFGLIFIDANGERIEEEVLRLLPVCRPDCYFVLDDYDCETKGAYIKPFVDKSVARGAFRTLSLQPHSTWFGQRAVLAESP